LNFAVDRKLFIASGWGKKSSFNIALISLHITSIDIRVSSVPEFIGNFFEECKSF
jgi:hypothetical protein